VYLVPYDRLSQSATKKVKGRVKSLKGSSQRHVKRGNKAPHRRRMPAFQGNHADIVFQEAHDEMTPELLCALQ
jgi:hypothetical protein